jgi:LPXTG-motif cell wall-anchored protein
MLALALWLLQATPDAGSDNTSTIRIVAGALAIVCIVVILLRRKKKASKEDWT